MKKMILGITAIMFVGTLCGCGTIRGIGEDIGSVGGVISSGSDHVKESVKNNPPGSKMGTKEDQ